MPEPNQMMQQDNISDHLSNERMVYHQNAHKIDNQANHKKQAKSFVVSQSVNQGLVIDRQKYDLLSQKYASLKEKTRTSVGELQRHITYLAQEKQELLSKEKD